jgi:hypothetical protein
MATRKTRRNALQFLNSKFSIIAYYKLEPVEAGATNIVGNEDGLKKASGERS